jgi:hypothetical protein
MENGTLEGMVNVSDRQQVQQFVIETQGTPLCTKSSQTFACMHSAASNDNRNNHQPRVFRVQLSKC